MTKQIIQTTEKRVVCLYRVSTVGQVDKDDIPMQKQYCREFAKRQTDWKIVKEFSEKGVSGFKISAKDRDAIQEIQKMALQGEFDILPSHGFPFGPHIKRIQWTYSILRAVASPQRPAEIVGLCRMATLSM